MCLWLKQACMHACPMICGDTEAKLLHAQIQGIEEVSAISVIGTIGMAWALGVIAVKLCVTPRVAGYAHTRLFPQLRSFGDAPELLVAVFDTVFTFGGQVNWLRYLMSMQQKRKFPLAVANVSAVMEGAVLPRVLNSLQDHSGCCSCLSHGHLACLALPQCIPVVLLHCVMRRGLRVCSCACSGVSGDRVCGLLPAGLRLRQEQAGHLGAAPGHLDQPGQCGPAGALHHRIHSALLHMPHTQHDFS